MDNYELLVGHWRVFSEILHSGNCRVHRIALTGLSHAQLSHSASRLEIACSSPTNVLGGPSIKKTAKF